MRDKAKRRDENIPPLCGGELDLEYEIGNGSGSFRADNLEEEISEIIRKSRGECCEMPAPLSQRSLTLFAETRTGEGVVMDSYTWRRNSRESWALHHYLNRVFSLKCIFRLF